MMFQGTKEQEQTLRAALSELKGTRGAAMPALQKAQEIYGYLPFEVQTIISGELGIPVEELYGITTFYSQFRLAPVGKYKIGVCIGTACYVKGGGEIMERLKLLLGIDDGQTSADGLFTLEATRCIGCCGLAPVLTVNDDVYGKLTLDDLEKIVMKYQTNEK